MFRFFNCIQVSLLSCSLNVILAMLFITYYISNTSQLSFIISILFYLWQIPEFDNLYLDMNGIIHQCSHPNDEDVHFRISEEKIFADIFHYLEVLFRIIKPRKVFFMAVDGVAPRAKMNQQRGRRFRYNRTNCLYMAYNQLMFSWHNYISMFYFQNVNVFLE